MTLKLEDNAFCYKCRGDLCMIARLTLQGTPTTSGRKRKVENHDYTSPKKARKLLMKAFDAASTKLDDIIKGDSFVMPQIPPGYLQPIFAYPVQLRRRNAGGAAVVAGAAPYVAPPVTAQDIGPMDQICGKCHARKFLGETPGILILPNKDRIVLCWWKSDVAANE
jgi:hypothetical protein